jgi:sulfatase maturation enzyme AslB (radical SAM superfamily)
MLATRIKELTILLTKECNLNCSYCSQKHIKDKPTKEKLQKLIDNFNKVKLFLDDFVFIDIFGGEPLLYQDQVKFLIKFLRQQEKELNRIFKIRIFTNGLINIDDVIFYKKYNVVFTISYDGLGNQRGKVNNYLFYNIQKLNELNLIDRISFSILNPKKDFLLKNYFYIAKKINNITKVTHYLIREPYLWTEEGVNSYLENFDKFIEFAKIYKKEYKVFPNYIQNKINFFNKNIQGCGSGITRFTISDEILDCGVINFENEFFAKGKNYLDLYKKYCDNCEIKNDCDKKCPKYFFDYPEIFMKTFCKIKKHEIKKIKELL